MLNRNLVANSVSLSFLPFASGERGRGARRPAQPDRHSTLRQGQAGLGAGAGHDRRHTQTEARSQRCKKHSQEPHSVGAPYTHVPTYVPSDTYVLI